VGFVFGVVATGFGAGQETFEQFNDKILKRAKELSNESDSNECDDRSGPDNNTTGH